jgi:hypothetical protein
VDVEEAMGCLFFEESPLAEPAELRRHWPAGRGGGALQSEGSLEAATAAPLRAGSITVHSHLTPHYAKGNSTDRPRLGYVVQTRPAASVREGRLLGFDHGRSAGNTPEERFSREQKAAAACAQAAASAPAAKGSSEA